MINLSELFAIILALSGTLIFVSTSLFYVALNRNKNASIARIRLYRHSTALFSSLLFLNVLFAIGFIFSVFSPSSDVNLIGVLVYALGISIFFIVLTRVILRETSQGIKKV
ncbi:hypothetical protein IG206_01185 [Candidatus Parvarchaeota archaeon]|nr:hypothetical protein [Candidatus Acidifodinimicrobium mancum]